MILGASLAFSGCVNETGSDPDLTVPPGSRLPAGVTERLDAALADGLALSGSSGALAGVWAPWAGDWVATPGTTTMAGDQPMTPDMRFRIGTNTTSMTCTVLLRLVEEGRVKLDDLVSRYLSRSAEVEGITLGQLCRNTSGLADYYRALSPQFVDNPTRRWPPMELLASGLAGKRLSAPGGAGRRLVAVQHGHHPARDGAAVGDPPGLGLPLPEVHLRAAGARPDVLPLER
jgi:D-alanyl-D-alanine carboxypeptidase